MLAVDSSLKVTCEHQLQRLGVFAFEEAAWHEL